VPFRQVLELLQREQIRSPDHWLWKVWLHLRHWRIFGTSDEGLSIAVSVAGDVVMPVPSRGPSKK
jgi:hypothetical protein